MFKHELYKTAFNKVTVAFMIIIIAVNILQLTWLEKSKELYPISAYNELWSDLEDRAGDSIEEWHTVLSDLEAEYKQMKIGSSSETSDYYAKYTGALGFESLLYSRVISEISDSLGYDDYVKSIAATKAKYDAMGSLASKDTYVYRNLVKTTALYEQLPERNPIPSSSAGIEMATDSDATDFLMIVLFVFFGITIWLKEKEQDILSIIRTTKNGRVKLAVTKLLVLATMCAISTSLLYLSSIFAAELTYGLGDVTRTIVSVRDYKGALWDINVLEFLALNMIAKIIACIWLAFLMSIICNAVSGSLAAFSGMAILSVASFALYTSIPALSTFSVFKYLNPFGIIKTQLLFQKYKGLNLFGYPFDYRKCVAVLLVIGIIAFSTVTIRLFIRHPLRSSKHSFAFMKTLSRVWIKIRRSFEKHVSIAGHEFYRIFISNAIIVVVLVALALQITSSQPYRVRYDTLADYYERHYLEVLSGSVTEDKKTFLETEKVAARQSSDEMAKDQIKAINSVNSRISYLEEKEGTYIIYEKPFGLLTAAEGNTSDISLAVFFMALLAFCIPVFFAPERQSGMYKVTSVTIHGRRKLVRTRYIIGSLLTFVLFLISYLPPFIQIISSYEVDFTLFSYPLGSLIHLDGFGTTMSIGMYLFIIGSLRFIAGILASLFIYKISALIKSHMYTMSVAFAVLLIPTLLAMIDKGLEFAVYPYSVFLGNMPLQNTVAAVTCIVTIIIVTVVLKLTLKKKSHA